MNFPVIQNNLFSARKGGMDDLHFADEFVDKDMPSEFLGGSV